VNPCHVAEVVLEFAAGEFRASFRLHGDHAYLLPLGEILPQEREADAREVAAASETSDHHVRLGVGHLHLRHGLLADDRLVQNHMVQHASQAVARVFRTAQSHLHGLGNGQPEASRTVRIALQRRTARFGQRRGRRHALRAPRVHHQAAVGLLVVADLDHEYLAGRCRSAGREGDRRAPLSGAGLGGQVLDALFVVVVGLRHGGVGLVRTRGRHAFVLEKDLRGRSEGLFQPRRAHERRRAPYPVNLLHLLGNVDVTLVDISWSISSSAKIADICSFVTGFFVPGCSGGSGLLGMSATMLYHCVGICFSVRQNFFRFIMGIGF